jgi:hypothetical protein
MAYGSLWFASGTETQQRLEELQTRLLAVQPRVSAASSTAELQQIVPLPAERLAGLEEQKQQVLQAINGELDQQRIQLQQQRHQFLIGSLLATLCDAPVSALMAAGLSFSNRRSIC